MKTKHFTVTIVHCSLETCLERKNFLTNDHLPWLEHFRWRKGCVWLGSMWFSFQAPQPCHGPSWMNLISSWKRLAPHFPSEPAEPGILWFCIEPSQVKKAAQHQQTENPENPLAPLSKMSILYLLALTQWLIPATEAEYCYNTKMVWSQTLLSITPWIIFFF